MSIKENELDIHKRRIPTFKRDNLRFRELWK